MQYDNTMKIYPTVSKIKEGCLCEELDEACRLSDYIGQNFSSDISYCTSVFKKTLRKVPNILKNSTKLRRMSRTNVIYNNTSHVYDTLELATANSSVKQKDEKQQQGVSHRAQKLPPLKILKRPVRSKRSKRRLKKLRRRNRTRQNSELKTSAVVIEQDVDCCTLSTDFTLDCPPPSCLQEIDDKVLKDAIDFASNEIFSTFYYDFYQNDFHFPVHAIGDGVDSSHGIYDSSGVDVNEDECDIYQVTDDENNENIEYYDIGPDNCCDFCLDHCISNLYEYKIDKKDLLLETPETTDEDSHVDDSNEETISMTIEQGNFQFRDINSTLTAFVDSNEKITDNMHQATVDQDKSVGLCVAEEAQSLNMNILPREYTLCEYCGMLFGQTDNFDEHIISCRSKKSSICETYICETCSKPYRYKSSLYKHIKQKHFALPEDNPHTFDCNMCNKVYRKFGPFLNHLKQHKICS